MRIIFCCVAAASVAGCSQSMPNASSGKHAIAAMLQANEPSVCADEDVERTVLETAYGGYAEYLSAGGPAFKFDLVSATEIKPEIHEVTCSATVVGLAGRLVAGSALETMEALSEDSPLPITYEVRPSLEGNYAFIVSMPHSDDLKGRLAWSILKWRSSKERPGAGSAMPDDSRRATRGTHDSIDGQESSLQLIMTSSDRQQLDNGQILMTLTGRVINPSDKSQIVPPIGAQLRSRSGKLVDNWAIQPPADRLPAHGSANFTSTRVGVPADGDVLNVVLGDDTKGLSLTAN